PVAVTVGHLAQEIVDDLAEIRGRRRSPTGIPASLARWRSRLRLRSRGFLLWLLLFLRLLRLRVLRLDVAAAVRNTGRGLAAGAPVLDRVVVVGAVPPVLPDGGRHTGALHGPAPLVDQRTVVHGAEPHGGGQL